MATRLSRQQVRDAKLTDWRQLAQAIHARFTISDFGAGASFVAAVAEAADAADHHPDVKLTYGCVDVSLCTHEDGRWVTHADVRLARTVSDIAARQGLSAAPGEVTQLELALDTADDDAISPFWAALLTGSADNRIYDSVFDPTDRVPPVWFQPTDTHDTPRQRWHFDLWLAPESASERVDAALAAGGTVVYDAGAPAFVVLADPDGNRVCVCTTSGRD